MLLVLVYHSYVWHSLFFEALDSGCFVFSFVALAMYVLTCTGSDRFVFLLSCDRVCE